MKLHYSEELCGAVQALLGGQYSVSGILALVADRVAEELDTAMTSGDALHSNLRNEYENGRLLRLLFKLGFINERPEYALAPQWAETGDRRASCLRSHYYIIAIHWFEWSPGMC